MSSASSIEKDGQSNTSSEDVKTHPPTIKEKQIQKGLRT